jgi:hypothetical protein
VPDSVGSVNTLDNYEWAIRLHLLPALGHRPLVKRTPADVVEMLRAKISAGMARKTVMRLRSVLVSTLDQALVEGLVVRNVAAITKPPKRWHRSSPALARRCRSPHAAQGSERQPTRGRIRNDADARPSPWSRRSDFVGTTSILPLGRCGSSGRSNASAAYFASARPRQDAAVEFSSDQRSQVLNRLIIRNEGQLQVARARVPTG